MRSLRPWLLLAAFVLSSVSLDARACPPHPPWPPHPPRIDDRPAPRGRLSVTSTPWAEVRVDGVPEGPTPLTGLYLDPGVHRVELRAACGRVTRSVRIEPGRDVRLAIDPCRAQRVMPAKTL